MHDAVIARPHVGSPLALIPAKIEYHGMSCEVIMA